MFGKATKLDSHKGLESGQKCHQKFCNKLVCNSPVLVLIIHFKHVIWTPTLACNIKILLNQKRRILVIKIQEEENTDMFEKSLKKKHRN